eukprot:365236-Chlamydomonas_euryale.AAC.5
MACMFFWRTANHLPGLTTTWHACSLGAVAGLSVRLSLAKDAKVQLLMHVGLPNLRVGPHWSVHCGGDIGHAPTHSSNSETREPHTEAHFGAEGCTQTSSQQRSGLIPAGAAASVAGHTTMQVHGAGAIWYLDVPRHSPFQIA